MATDHKHRHAHPPLDEVLALLRASGLKLTPPRKALLEALVAEHGPFTAEELHKKISRRICDQATVYRCLASMEEAGILRRCEFGDGSARYELAGEGSAHHHHLICRLCRRVVVLDECELGELDAIAEKRGFTQVAHSLEFFGICPSCK